MWRDAVGVISSFGHYLIDDWDAQLDRIDEVVRREGKLAEATVARRYGRDGA